MGKKIKILWVGDGVVPTGFARVNHSIIENLPKDKYEIHHLAINYSGDPHDFQHNIYPASTGGDVYGLRRIANMVETLKPDLVFILNDIWNISFYMDALRDKVSHLPPIVAYFPVDGKYYDIDSFQNFDLVTRAVTYTWFGLEQVNRLNPDLEISIIPHGVSTKVFHPIQGGKVEARKRLFPEHTYLHNEDVFIVLNVNRNQPRKRLDVALTGFAEFAKGKPDNVFYYHHAGIVDAGWNVIKIAKQLGITDRLITTSYERTVQRVPDNVLNVIYNSADAGINTSLGEGWGLPQVEHAVTQAAQITPDHSACQELFSDCGILMPISQELYLDKVLTLGGLVHPHSVAESLEKLYADPSLTYSYARKAYLKFTRPEYSWETIALKWDALFDEVLSK